MNDSSLSQPVSYHEACLSLTVRVRYNEDAVVELLAAAEFTHATFVAEGVLQAVQSWLAAGLRSKKSRLLA